MTLKLTLLMAIAVATVPWLSATAQTGNTAPPAQSSGNQPPQAQACPPGTHWEEAGYIGHGKYRPARCARDNGRE